MLMGYRWWLGAERPGRGWHLRSVAVQVWWDGSHLRAPTPPRDLERWDGESLTCFGPLPCE